MSLSNPKVVHDEPRDRKAEFYRRLLHIQKADERRASSEEKPSRKRADSKTRKRRRAIKAARKNNR